MLSLWNYVRVCKMNAVQTPELPTANEFDPAQAWIDQDKSPPNRYTVEGYIAREPEVGSSLYVLRTNRNGVQTLGYFSTSLITEIFPVNEKTTMIRTKNSVYQIDVLEQPTNKPQLSI